LVGFPNPFGAVTLAISLGDMLILAGTLSHRVKAAKNSVMKELFHLPSGVELPLCWCSIRWRGDVFICAFIVEKRFLC